MIIPIKVISDDGTGDIQDLAQGIRTASDINSDGFDVNSGFGLLNAEAASLSMTILPSCIPNLCNVFMPDTKNNPMNQREQIIALQFRTL